VCQAQLACSTEAGYDDVWGAKSMPDALRHAIIAGVPGLVRGVCEVHHRVCWFCYSYVMVPRQQDRGRDRGRPECRGRERAVHGSHGDCYCMWLYL
jgi:hypothetical protein